MKLSIVGTESLNHLEKMAKEYFSPIKNLHLKGFNYSPSPVGKFPKGRLFEMSSSGKNSKLIVIYFFESLIGEQKMSPLYFVKRLFEDESEGGLKMQLKREGLILNLNAEQLIH